MKTALPVYSIHSHCHFDKSKSKCGDYFLFKELTNENIVLLTLSDGVGSRHHDNIASQTACNSFIESFSENNVISDLSQRFEEAIKSADKKVSNPSDPSHKGMMCTFVGVAWDLKENVLLYANIGDSRLYKYTSSGITQVSEDSKKAVNMRDRNGKLIRQSGVLVIREGLTNALGYSGAQVNIKKLTFEPGEALIFCSDGMYEIYDFDDLISEVIANLDIEKSLKKCFTRNQANFKDDASILILRRSDQPENCQELYQRVILESLEYSQNNIIPHLLIKYIQSKILSLIDLKDESEIMKYVNYVDKSGLVFSEKFIENSIQLMKSRNYVIRNLYEILIKQLKIIKW